MLTIRCDESELGGGTLDFQLGKTAEDINGKVRITGLQLEHLKTEEMPPFTGQVDADLDLNGSLRKPKAKLEVELADFTYPYNGTDDVTSFNGKLRAHYEQARLRGTLDLTTNRGNRLKAEGRLPIALSVQPFQAVVAGELKASTHFSGDLTSISPLFLPPSQRVSGEITGDLNISGPVHSPSWKGNINLDDGTYENVATGTVIQALQMHVEVEDKKFSIATLKGTDGKTGSVTGSGDIEMNEHGIAGNVALQLEQMRLLQSQEASGTIGGDLQLSLTNGTSLIKGDLRIDPVELRIPKPRPKGMKGIEVIDPSKKKMEDAQEKRKTAPSFLDNTALDVKIDLPARCFIRGRGLDSEWQGEIRVAGTAAQPEIGGKIAVVRGHVDFLTKRFDLEESTIRFQKSSPPRPILNITAVNRKKDITIRLRATGPVDAPEITLDSDPAYPRDEIMARLLFNRELREITPVQAVRLAFAVRTLTGSGGDVMEKLRRNIGVDELELRTTEEGETVAGVGKYLAEGVYFRVEQSAGEETTQVFVEVELTPNLSLETRTGTMTEGIDFKWSYRY